VHPSIPGTIPEYTEREAARFNGYTWSEWGALTHGERVHGVAFHHVSVLVNLHAEERSMANARREVASQADG
jgi:hypothetical protein